MFESTSILGLSWTAILGDLFSVLSAISGPVLLLMVLRLYLKCRGQSLPPVLFPAILFALTSVTIQILSASLTITGGYRYSGRGADVLWVFFRNVRPLFWRVIEVAACILIAAAFQFIKKTPARKTETNSSSGVLIAICSAAALASGGLFWFYVNVVRSQAALFDPSRPAEAAAGWAKIIGGGEKSLGFEVLFRLLSRPFLVLSFSAAALSIVLIILGLRSLKSGLRRSWDFAVSGLLAMAILGTCLPALSGMARDAQYLRTLSLDRSVPFAPVRSFPVNSETMMDLLFPRFEIPARYLVDPPPPPPELTRTADIH
jgi:hypothetical protein